MVVAGVLAAFVVGFVLCAILAVGESSDLTFR
jgi:hypothetical protein